MTGCGHPGDRGSGTVLVLAVVGALAVLLTTALLALAAMQARGRAQTAADLGAIAGAASFSDRCATAGRVVTANGAALTDCAVEGTHVRVRAAVAVSWGGRPTGLVARAAAHAGPAGALPGAEAPGPGQAAARASSSTSAGARRLEAMIAPKATAAATSAMAIRVTWDAESDSDISTTAGAMSTATRFMT